MILPPLPARDMLGAVNPDRQSRYPVVVRHRIEGLPHRCRLLGRHLPCRRLAAIAIDVPGQLTLDDSDLMLVAALAGEGLAFLSYIAAAKSIEAGLLLPVLEDWSPEYPGLCLYYPSRRNIPAERPYWPS